MERFPLGPVQNPPLPPLCILRQIFCLFVKCATYSDPPKKTFFLGGGREAHTITIDRRNFGTKETNCDHVHLKVTKCDRISKFGGKFQENFLKNAKSSLKVFSFLEFAKLNRLLLFEKTFNSPPPPKKSPPRRICQSKPNLD